MVWESPARISPNSRRARGSRLLDGSSSTSTSGSMLNTAAVATRFLCPKERWCGARPLHPHGSKRALHPLSHLVPGEPQVRRPEGDVLFHGGHEQHVFRV